MVEVLASKKTVQRIGGTSYEVRGEGDWVVLVHGVGMQLRAWDPQVTAFSDKYRVLSYDLLGHGNSDLPPEEATLEDFIDQLDHLITRLDARGIQLVGHSLGSLIALGYSLRRPERVQSVAALNGVFCRSEEEKKAVQNRSVSLSQGNGEDLIVPTLNRWFGENPCPARARCAEQLAIWLREADKIGYARTYKVFANSDRAHEGKLQRLTVPALFATGELDPNSTPAMSAAMAKAAPLGTYVSLDGERHVMTFDAPDRVNNVLREFWKDQQMPQFDPREFRRALGTFVTGVTVVTTESETGEKRGFTANSFTSVSLDPPLVLVCLSKTSSSLEIFEQATSYVINVLTEDQKHISNQFASKVPDKFLGIETRRETTASPVIADTAAWFDCVPHNVVDAGDHIVLIGKVQAFGGNQGNPLVYHKGGYITFGLAQEAITASENTQHASTVGILLEQDEHLYFETSADGGLMLPTAPRLGGSSGLQAKLKMRGLEVLVGFVFAVFEDNTTDQTAIYYRGSAAGKLNDGNGRWIPIDSIDQGKISDMAVRSMVKRFIAEHRQDAFGVYFGDSNVGRVGALQRSMQSGG
ncbi:alpha/beta fold hydrolase [Ruegeria arenilitoris]|uniref:alpha/beta fold hydrolase n=1 Tax=Ruegeria arenilitoris TaxID=1173585 RepID=UPI00147FE53B|nr:alpha/beta fold hydrolase [Ruegeria arenilitoris]